MEVVKTYKTTEHLGHDMNIDKRKYRLSRRGKVVMGGIVLLIFSMIFLANAINGETIEQRDCTALIFSLPVAFGMIFYKGDDK